MYQNEVNELLELVSPKYYQEFRRLYNELLGYLEREEYDKIDLFSKRLDGLMSRAYFAQVALSRRLEIHKKQDGIMQKSVLHDRFRNPKKTVEVTHFFPLKIPVEITQKQDEFILNNKKSVEVKSPDDGVNDVHSLGYQRELAKLNDAMTDYNKSKGLIEDDPILNIKQSKLNVDLDKAQMGSDFVQINEDGYTESNTEIFDKGAITDDLDDHSLYFKKKAKSTDVERANLQENKSMKKQVSEEVSTEIKNNKKSEDNRNRHERVWDYIEKDKSSGQINHDL